MTIHWCDTGLSALPGLRRLADAGHDVVIWNRPPHHPATSGHLAADIQVFDREAIARALRPDDVVVSTLPGQEHLPLAATCTEAGAHLVCATTISPALLALEDAAQKAGVSLVAEAGLAPGIDHLFARWLVADYLKSPGYGRKNPVSLTTCCGAFPKVTNAFRAKFSQPSVDMLASLTTPARAIRAHTVLDVTRPWHAITRYDAPLPVPETFEVYPTGDSRALIEAIGFDEEWPVQECQRGTLQLNGWAEAWKGIFAELETLSGANDAPRLKQIAERLREEHPYGDDDPDRVVLCVHLRAERDGIAVYDKTWTLDAHGDARGSAMARLTSVPVALTVEAVLADGFDPGVTRATHDPALLESWRPVLDTQAQFLHLVDHLA